MSVKMCCVEKFTPPPKLVCEQKDDGHWVVSNPDGSDEPEILSPKDFGARFKVTGRYVKPKSGNGNGNA